ncbi:DUF998 domain-containing protein [Cryobacterium sp. M15]|uniref:DUF998 domain-containing protein n=1 Tax=Cryobacterium sp. M15 TaxID=2048291 RepID=UPI000CE49725|nr:DUF998 domain-containing protein [Cryobacterium sp. M15]
MGLRRVSASAAMLGVLGYVAVDVVLQLLPPHYSPISEAESNLAVGPFGWVMSVNFLGRAATTLCALVAIGQLGTVSALHRIGLLLLGVAGLCSGVLAFFPTDIPAAGAGLVAETAAGLVHLVFATLGFLTAFAAIVLLTRSLHRNALLPESHRAALIFTAIAMAGLLFLLLTVTVAPGLLGLAERICLLGILGWVFFVCAGMLRLNARVPAPSPP